MKRLVIGAMVAVIGGVGLAACTPWHHKSTAQRAEWISKRVASKLDLTEEQTKKMNVMRDEIVGKLQANRAARETLGAEFETLVRSDKIDQKKLADLRDKKQKLHSDMEQVVADKLVEFHAILTPEQRSKAADYLHKFAEKHKQRTAYQGAASALVAAEL